MTSQAFSAFNIWQHSSIVKELYRKRARDEVEEMTCAQQAVDLLQPFVVQGDTLLDVGCGSGYFYHSLRKRNVPVIYSGFDQTECLIKIGLEELPSFGLEEKQLQVCRIEDYQGCMDHVVCMNVLSNVDNFHRPLERLLLTSHKTLILRESISEKATYSYVRDVYLDPDVDLKVHVNTYDKEEIRSFIESYGFDVKFVLDNRTQGQPELVIGYPHHWTFVVATVRSN